MNGWMRKGCLGVLGLGWMIASAWGQNPLPESLILEEPVPPEHLGGRAFQENAMLRLSAIEEPAETPEAEPAAAASSAPRIIFPPDDAEYVGVVDHRFLKRSEMDYRVNRMLLMTDAIGWKNDEDRERMRKNLEEMVLFEWADLTLMAVHAEQQGLTATEAELQEKMNEIYTQEQERPEVANTIRAIGIDREELATLVRDGILAEKLVASFMRENLTDADLRQIHSMMPQMFMTPEQVELNFMVMRTNEESVPMKRQLNKEMKQWRDKAARKGRFLEVAKEFNEPELGQRGGYFGWASARSLPREESATIRGSHGEVLLANDNKIVEAVFGLKEGEVSEVLSCANGFYVFQLIQRREATGLNYASARPRIESALYEEMKAVLMQRIKREHTVYLATGGIDFDAIAEVAQSDVDIRELRLQQRKEKFFEHFGDRLLHDPQSPRKPASTAEISEASKAILANYGADLSTAETAP